MKSLNGAAATRLLCTVCVTGCIGLFASSTRGEWSTYQADPAHDGHVATTVSPTSHDVLWSTKLPQGSLTHMAVGGGKVYVSTDLYFGSATAPNFFAVDQHTGATVWSHAFGSVYSENAPTYVNGVVYVQVGKGTSTPAPTLYAFNAASGSTIFSSVYAAQWERYLAPTVVDGKVYVDGGYYGGMYSFDAANGSQKWFGAVPQYDGWTPSVAGPYCFAFTGSGDTTPITGKFTIINSTTGATVAVTTDNGFYWSGYTMNQAPAIGSLGDAWVTNGGRLLSFGLSQAAGILRVLNDSYSGQPSVANGVVYCPDGTSLAALSESTGSTLWKWTPPDGLSPLGQTIVTDNMLLTSTSSHVYAVDLAGHTTAWSVAATGHLALSDNELFVSATDGTLTAISVPEPASAAWLALLASPLLLSRRRGCNA